MRIPLPRLAFASAVRMVDRVHDDPAHMRRFPFQRVRPALPTLTFS